MIFLAAFGAIMIGAAYVIGVPPDFDVLHGGQACLIAGVAALTWALLNTFERLVDVVPITVGLGVLIGLGMVERDVLGFAGGLAILAICARNLWNARRPV